VNRKALERHLRREGARFERNGSKHAIWRGPQGDKATIPRHKEIKEGTAHAICDQLGVRSP
jgi:predicted RNA binding protein YcfA (HicA-like mRNA interferase family)